MAQLGRGENIEKNGGNLVQLAAGLGETVALLQGSGAGPLALFGQSAGELLVLRSLLLQLIRDTSLFFFQAPHLATLKFQLRGEKSHHM